MTDHNDRNQREIMANRRRRDRGALFAGKHMWVILILGAMGVTALVVLGSMKKQSSASATASLSTFTARRDDLTITVTESGSINARNTIDITCQVEAGRMGGGVGGGGVTILSIVPEGSYITPEDVNNGKVLVELDSSVLEEQIEQYKIDVETARASFTEANESYLIQIKQNESDISAAELAVKFAKMDFQKYLGEDLAEEVIGKLEENPDSGIDVSLLLRDALIDPNDPNSPSDPNDPNSPSDPNDLVNQGGGASQMLKELRDAILMAEGQRQRDTDVLAGTQKLYDANYASALDLQKAKLDVQRFRFQTESANEALRLYKLYDFPKEAEKFLSDYEEAKRELDRTKARTRSMLAQAEAKLLSAKSRYELQDQRLKKSQRQIDACLIKAPAPGLVVYASSQDVFMRRGGGTRRTIAEGETVYERQKIITLPDTAEMIAEIAVHEAEVDKVRAGQRAVITLDPFPDQEFKGQVLKVAQLPDAQRGFLNPDLKVYTTQVLIEGTHDYLKPGMSAKVEIRVQELKDVIIVPVTVVANRQGKKVCFVLAPDGSSKERIVKTGAFDDTFVEIAEGLEEGEKVLLNPPRITETGSGYESGRRSSERFESDEPGAGPSPAEPPPGGPPQPGMGPGPGGRTRGGPGQGGRGQGPGGPGGEGRQRRERPPGGGGEMGGPRASQGRGGPGGGGGQGRELTPERIEMLMGILAQRDPAKAKELEPLRKSDPEKFKVELRKAAMSMFSGMRQGGNQGGPGGNAGPGRGQNQ
ncbi:MAG: efflux RND transporter periplasmic adaptor subunit [Planctomycetota bacterium]|jgi:multidrug resistance efflux pump